MGFPNPFKAAKKVVKKIAKPFRKISQKFIPKEIRPVLPFLAAATPFMLPAGGFGASGLFSSAAGRGFLSSLANVAGQAGADPEGDDINLLSTLLAGGTGALSTPGMGENLRSGIMKNNLTGADAGEFLAAGQDIPGVGFFQGAENIGREGLATAADYLSGSAEGIAALGNNPEKLFTKAGAKGLAKAVAVPFSQGSGDVAKASADKMMRDYLAADAEEQAQMEETTTANEQEAADLTMRYYREAGHSEDTIQAALETNDLGEYYTPPESAANGGIIGLKEGGMLNFGGREMDLRGGGFVPIGRKERADDVPARLSKNEFVMTADAVRAAGGGSVNKGAQRMYDVMNKLEARA
jgi:hypothetical protein